MFLCSLARESSYSKSGYSFPDYSWIGIRDSQVKSRQSRLNRDAWTLCKGFWGSRGILPWKKEEIWSIQTAENALKLSILPSPCYFCIILNILRSHQADLFGSWGVGGGGCVLRAPPPPYPGAWEDNSNFTTKKNKKSLAGANCDVTQTMDYLVALIFVDGKMYMYRATIIYFEDCKWWIVQNACLRSAL